MHVVPQKVGEKKRLNNSPQWGAQASPLLARLLRTETQLKFSWKTADKETTLSVNSVGGKCALYTVHRLVVGFEIPA